MKLRRLLLVAAGPALTAAVLAGVVRPGSVGPAGAAVAPRSAPSSAAVTRSATVTRDHLVNGLDDVVDSRTVSVTVDRTTDLTSNESVDVSWTGAHPTGGVVADVNGDDAPLQEYPMVLLECRGTDSTTVPVDQQISPETCWTATPRERYQDSYSTPFPPWRVDRYATPTDRDAIVGAPSPRPATCFAGAYTEHWVPFVAANGTVYPGGADGCAATAPEAAAVGGLNMPSNTTYGITRPDGTGSARFDVWTSQDNASLGCSNTVPCSLVAVPIMGISCDVAAAGLPADDQPAPGPEADAASAGCEQSGIFAPGQTMPASQGGQLAVSGQLWWSASNWHNRIVVPLSFAPPSNVCAVINSGSSVSVYGSELLAGATEQWAPHFCLDPTLFTFKHVISAEPEARSLLQSGGIEAAFSSGLPDGGFSTPTVNAPAALTGFAVTFSIDDASGNPVTSLNLDARLLAKLLTESYPAILQVRAEYPALAHNPLDITDDPEFRALNPGVGVRDNQAISASTLLSIGTDSDVVEALTSYINADPEARAWLDGTPDPWGMTVNPHYKGISLPSTSWPLLDTFEPAFTATTNQCLYDSPVPFLPLVAAPQASLADDALDMQFSLAQSTTVCNQVADGVTAGEKLVALGRQQPGYRFMLGVTTLADAELHGLSTAALETQSTVAATQAVTSAAGRTFVAPSPTSLAAAAATLQPDAASDTWPVPYASWRTDPAGAGAYPGTMLVYAQVPTQGLSPSDAADYATLLRFIAGPGQTPGTGLGQLPAGYLPLTAANHLGAQAAYTLAAADAVAAQDGQVPPLVPSTSPAPAQVAGLTGGLSNDLAANSSGDQGSAAQAGALPVVSTQGGKGGASGGSGHAGLLERTVAALSELLRSVAGVLALVALGAGLAAGLLYLLGVRRRARRAAEADPGVAGEPPPVEAPPRPGGRSLGVRPVAIGALLTISALALWCLAFGFVLSPLQEHRSQTELQAELRGTLAGQTSPIGGRIPAGVPIGLLDVPSLGIHKLAFVEGTNSVDLEAGPGHRPDTPLPGQPGVSVLQGRSSLFGAPFRRIWSLRPGAIIRVTTGQGTFVYRVKDRRHAGDREPAPVQLGQGRLTLVTAGQPPAGAHPAHLEALYVDATLQGGARPASAGRPVGIGAAQTAMYGDAGALASLVLWLGALAGAAVLVGWLVARWRRAPALLLAAPALLALLWVTTEAAARLLPNLW